MERKALIAIILSTLILILYPYFIGKFYPPGEKPSFPKEEKEEMAIEQTIINKEIKKETELDDTVIKTFDTAKYQISFSLRGGCVTQIKLKGYIDSDTHDTVRLFSISNLEEAVFATEGLSSQVRPIPLYKISEEKDGIVFAHKIDESYEVIKKFSFNEDKYTIDLKITMRNLTPQSQKVKFSITGGSNITETRELDGRFIEVVNSINGKLIRDSLRRIIAKGEVFHPGDTSWIALKNKYFSTILKTFVPTTSSFSKRSQAGRIFTGVEVKESVIPANSSTVQEFVLYAGPNDLGELKKANLGLEGALNFGLFGSVSFLLLDVLKFLFSLLHNWGLAIIVLTFIVSILLYPLTWKSFKSMKEIQLIQPKIEKLRLEYKDNTQKFNKEVMQLYRKHKVNPFGGCLPILLQMPIFIALYQVFMRSIELRGAKFLWINDLSLPDRASLPFSLPLIGNRINILPLLMVGFMFLQQKTMAKQAVPGKEEQQRAMAMLMPLLFGFMFYNLPSGLVLYWLTQTLLMTFYQWRIGRSMVVKEE